MTDPVKQQLSACLDGELPAGELDLLLKQVSRDPPLGRSLGRYALIGEVLRARDTVAAPADFSTRVGAAVAAEPPLSAHATPGRVPVQWLKPVAGAAVAAGVAAIAILSLQPPADNRAPSYASVPAPSATEAASAADPSYIVSANSTTASGFVPAARLTNYVVAHSEYSTPLGRRSVLSGVLSEEEAEVGAAEAPPADTSDMLQP